MRITNLFSLSIAGACNRKYSNVYIEFRFWNGYLANLAHNSILIDKTVCMWINWNKCFGFERTCNYCSRSQYEYVDCTYNIFILHAKHPKPIGKAPPFESPYHVIVILLLRNWNYHICLFVCLRNWMVVMFCYELFLLVVYQVVTVIFLNWSIKYSF